MEHILNSIKKASYFPYGKFTTSQIVYEENNYRILKCGKKYCIAKYMIVDNKRLWSPVTYRLLPITPYQPKDYVIPFDSIEVAKEVIYNLD